MQIDVACSSRPPRMESNTTTKGRTNSAESTTTTHKYNRLAMLFFHYNLCDVSNRNAMHTLLSTGNRRNARDATFIIYGHRENTQHDTQSQHNSQVWYRKNVGISAKNMTIHKKTRAATEDSRHYYQRCSARERFICHGAVDTQLFAHCGVEGSFRFHFGDHDITTTFGRNSGETKHQNGYCQMYILLSIL